VDYLVTAGGTSERIDGVRSITNFATGRLGSLIAEKLAGQSGAECAPEHGTGKIFYVCGKHAVRPNLGTGGRYMRTIEVVPVEGVSDLEAQVREILRENKIGAIAHTMAVSDYYVDRVLDATGNKIKNADKIDSSHRELRLVLKPAKKIIGMFHELSPESVLVGFKLLNRVPETTLLDAAYALLVKNNCAAVLANDLTAISGEKHAAFLLDAQKNIVRFETKEQIAQGICRFIQQTVPQTIQPETVQPGIVRQSAEAVP
jgi:phosphopantothenate-cysteine ligase